MAAPRVVIVGGGFGGLAAARALAHAPVEVLLLDCNNYHLFQPLLYQVATAALAPTEIAYPIRGALAKQRNARVWLAEAIGFDLDQRRVRLKDSYVSYDYLIVAAGASHSYFGHPEWEQAAPGLKELGDALEVRSRILLALEQAEREPNATRRREILTFVVVGAGPTGVELAGAISKITRKLAARDYRGIAPGEITTILLEAGPRILATFPERLAAKAMDALGRRNVMVRTGARVVNIEPGRIAVGEDHIAAGAIFWAAGVAASPLARGLHTLLDSAGRVLVEPDLTIAGYPQVFVVGDLAAMSDARGRQLPGVAPVAMQQGRHAAKNVQLALQGQRLEPFRYHDKGTLATIGRAAAVADFGNVQLSGFAGWVTWLVVHIYFLIGFRNRIAVIMDWAWSYLTWQLSGRIITVRMRDGVATVPTSGAEEKSYGGSARVGPAARGQSRRARSAKFGTADPFLDSDALEGAKCVYKPARPVKDTSGMWSS